MFISQIGLTSTDMISDSGISNMASSKSFSRMALRPLAPVFFLMASLAMQLRASRLKVRSTCQRNNEHYGELLQV